MAGHRGFRKDWSTHMRVKEVYDSTTREWVSPEVMKERKAARCTASAGPAVHVWKPMWFNDITTEPIYVESKEQLRRECAKHNVRAARLM